MRGIDYLGDRGVTSPQPSQYSLFNDALDCLTPQLPPLLPPHSSSSIPLNAQDASTQVRALF